jgi:hypothetical protein
MGSVLQLRWPTPPSFGEGVSLLFVQAVVGVAPLSALLLAAIASDVSYVRDTPRLLQVRPAAAAARCTLHARAARRALKASAPCASPDCDLTWVVSARLRSGVRCSGGAVLRLLSVRALRLRPAPRGL